MQGRSDPAPGGEAARRQAMSPRPSDTEWIGVAHVAAELGLTGRQAWELIKTLGVPCIGPTRDCMRLARFTRAEWEQARDASKRPPTPRASSRAPRKAARPLPAGPGIRLMDVVRAARKGARS